MCTIEEVNKVTQTVLIRFEDCSVMLYDNRIVSQIGFLTPVQLKKAYRVFNAIKNEQFK